MTIGFNVPYIPIPDTPWSYLPLRATPGEWAIRFRSDTDPHIGTLYLIADHQPTAEDVLAELRTQAAKGAPLKRTPTVITWLLNLDDPSAYERTIKPPEAS